MYPNNISISKSLVKDCIFTSLMILMKEKNFDDISIKEITQKAGVSRMSYYRTYSSKEDILIQYFDDLFENCLSKVKSTDIIDKYHLNSKLFHVFGENHILIQNIVHAKLYDLLLIHFIEYTTYLSQHVFHQDINDPKISYKIYAEAGCLCVLLVHWIDLGMKETPEEMSQLLENFSLPH